MTIKLKGGPELLRLLDELPKNLERNVIRGGLRAGAKVIQQQAKANVPVRTGKLKKAIGIGTRVEGSKLSSYVKLRGTGSYLGLFIEYGVAPHLISVSDADKPALVEVLISQLGRGDSDTQFGLTRFLCAIGEPIVAPLMHAAQSADETVRTQAEFTLIRFQEMELEKVKKK